MNVTGFAGFPYETNIRFKTELYGFMVFPFSVVWSFFQLSGFLWIQSSGFGLRSVSTVLREKFLWNFWGSMEKAANFNCQSREVFSCESKFYHVSGMFHSSHLNKLLLTSLSK